MQAGPLLFTTASVGLRLPRPLILISSWKVRDTPVCIPSDSDTVPGGLYSLASSLINPLERSFVALWSLAQY